jgi:hypothetical protein
VNRLLPCGRRRLSTAGSSSRGRALLVLLLVGAFVAVPAASSTQTDVGCADVHETMCGDGGAATHARLLRPLAVSLRPGGGFLIADAGNDAIRAVSARGSISTVAGLGTAGYTGDHGPAIAAQLDTPSDVAVASDGALLIADTGNNVIRRVAKNGTITTVAGSGGTDPSTTPVAATTVRLAAPRGLAVLPGGDYLIADTDANVILRVSATGLRTVAGTGSAGYAGDGGSALNAALDEPTRLVATSDGGFLILDQGNGVVRRVSSSGLITSVPGTTATQSQDLFGQLAVNPGGLAVDPAGNLILSDERQVVRVSPRGARTVLAGTGDCDSSGDGGAALDATFATPTGLAYSDAGILVSDYNNQAEATGNIRLIKPDGTIATVAGKSDTGHCIGAGGAPTGSLWPVFYITAPHQARAYRPIVIKFASTRASTVRTSLFQGARRIRTTNRLGALGLNTVTFSRGVSRGSYRMEIRATAVVGNNNADEGGTLTLNKRFAAPLAVGR